MSDQVVVLSAMAEAFDAAAATLRQRIAVLGPPSPGGDPLSAVQRARIVNPQLGPRQTQIIEILEEFYPSGTDMGHIARKTGQDQPNVYLTLKGLKQQEIVEKDSTTRPHKYRLSPDFMNDGE